MEQISKSYETFDHFSHSQKDKQMDQPSNFPSQFTYKLVLRILVSSSSQILNNQTEKVKNNNIQQKKKKKESIPEIACFLG